MKPQKCRHKNIILFWLTAFLTIQIPLISLSYNEARGENISSFIDENTEAPDYPSVTDNNMAAVLWEYNIQTETLPQTGRHTDSNRLALIFLMAAVLACFFYNPKNK